MLLNSKKFKQISFFLANRKEVNSLEEGAKLYGGATLLNGRFYSNYEDGSYIKLLEGKNSISIVVPSTLDADIEIDNSEYVAKYLSILNKEYEKITVSNSVGSWYSDDLNKVIIEKNTIITINSENLSVEDVNSMLNLAILIREDMKQEAVSVLVNDSLCIV